jgi:hypothetical protein
MMEPVVRRALAEADRDSKVLDPQCVEGQRCLPFARA